MSWGLAWNRFLILNVFHFEDEQCLRKTEFDDWWTSDGREAEAIKSYTFAQDDWLVESTVLM